MKRLATILVLLSMTLMTAVNANCNARQKREPNGTCFNCPAHTRAQPYQGNTNAYCQGDVCPDSRNTQKTYINIADGTCQQCQAGTVPSAVDTSNGLRTRCVASGNNNAGTCNGCLQYRDNFGNCQTCTGNQVVNFNKNGCTFRPNCQVGQYYNSCNVCQNCQAGTTYNSNTGTCVANQNTNCACDSEYNSNSRTCVRCPVGQTSDNANRRCAVKSQTCNQFNQVQGTQSQCYACSTCQAGTTFNRNTNSCVQNQVQRPQCSCYQQFNSQFNRCDSCPVGQLSNNQINGVQNQVCRVYNQNCGNNQVRLTQTQCYGCSQCQVGQVYNSQLNQCQTQVQRPQCLCYQQYNAQTNRCDNCNVGQLSGNSPNYQQGVCRAVQQNCAASGQIQLSQQQCYACQGCQAGWTLVNGRCQQPRPQCSCFQEYNQGSNQCVNCPLGQLSGNQVNGQQNQRCRAYQQNCAASGQVQLGQQQCYACQGCQAGWTLVNGRCQQPRPQCSCFQEYNQANNQCVNCPLGQLSGNAVNGQQNQRCRAFTQNCNTRGQVQLGQQQCFACQACPAGQSLVGNVCQVPRPRCNCYQEYNQANNQCVTCPLGQLSGNAVNGQQNQRCRAFTQNCNTRGQVQLGQQQCFACQACSGNQQLVGNVCRVPRPQCNCYQQYNQATNRCDNCPNGQLSGNGPGQQNQQCRAFTQSCNQNGQIQLNQQQCYACQACGNVGEIIVGNRCVVRATCQCFQEYNAATNTCRNCPAGQLANGVGNFNNNLNQGRCQPFSLGCNQNGRRQLPQQQCYQCQDCPVGQILGTNNVCVVPRPTCRCHEIVNQNNQCQACPAGQLADAGNSRCVTKANTCNTGNQVRGDQLSCYACITCGQFQVPNASRTACVARPFVNCGCLSRRDNTGYQCISCPVGQVAQFNNLNNNINNQNQLNANTCVAQQVCDQFSYRLPRDATSCARCQRCNWPSQIPDPVTGTRCVNRPRPNCSCTQRYGDQGYSCLECPFGQVRSATKQDECVNPGTCSGTNQIRLAVDATSCGRCQTCDWPRFIPDASRTQCVARPLAVCNDCTQRQSADGYSCEQCPAGQVQDPNNIKRCYRPTCTGQYQIQLAYNNLNCGRCETCQWPQYLPNASRTQCVLRPRAVCNSCTTRQSDDGYSCVACPVGSVQFQDSNINNNNALNNNLNANRCYVPTCNGIYDIQLRIDNRSCGRCQACAWPRQIPNNERTACVNRPFAQCSDCLTKRSADNYSCEQCPFGQVQDPTNMNRCVTRTCNGQRQIQRPVDNQSCGKCETCQWPQFMPDATKTQCVARPLAVCDCRQKQSADGYSCVTCPAGMVQSLTNQKQCVRPNCGGQYEIQLGIDTNNCGRCETCQWPQFAPNASRTQCVARPLANCNCLSRRAGLGYTCERCPAGLIQDPNNVNQCMNPNCYGTYQITKPVDATSCGKCEDCQFPRYIPNNERTQCILRPFAKCDCLSKQSQDRYSCEECPYGQRQDPRNPQRCIEAPRCNVGNQIVGLRDTQSCYNCRTCTLPQIPRQDRSECYRPRPTCSCTEKYSVDGYSCLPCPNGQVADDARNQCYQAPQCYGPREILGTRQNCYRCNTCPANLVPNDTRTACVRPIPVCSCTQRYSADGYDCLECPNRQVVDPSNNKRCVPQQCNARDQIFSTREYCYRCDTCPAGYQPNPQRTECLRIKPKCSCTEIYDSSGYVCVPCPPFQVATNGNQRCVPRQCSGLNEVLGTADTCYACKECQKGSTPDNLRRRCLRYITTACTCNQRFDDSGFGCLDCPAGTRPSLDNRSCVSLNCDKDQILRRDLLCPQCEWCPPGSIPDPKRENCIVKPRPAINVNGVPTCDEFSVFNMDRTECIKCPSNLKASADNLRCLNSCTDPLDIVQEDGSCFTCCNGNVPNYSRTRCVKKKTQTDTCTGDREIYNSDRTRCTTCDPYTRAQRQNTVCLSDQCGANQIITWLGTCANCLDGEKKVDQFTCSGSSGTRLNSLIAEEPVEEVAKKEKSFPTVVVAGLGILIMVLSAVTGMICMRRNDKTVQEVPAEIEMKSSADATSIDQVIEKAATDDSGSNGKNSE